MKKLIYLVTIISIGFSSCDWAKDKAKKTVHKTGEIVGKTGSEFADGVAEGVEESFSNKVSVTSQLQEKGISLGKVVISGSDSARDNKVSVYLIFNQSFEGKLIAKALDSEGKEFGRSIVEVSATKDDAKFIDFVFDKRTNLDRNDKVVIE